MRATITVLGALLLGLGLWPATALAALPRDPGR